MIKICGCAVGGGHFPDGTTNLRIPIEVYGKLESSQQKVIDWRFESNEELVLMQFIVAELHDKGYKNLILKMPYIPYARQDDAKTDEEILLLKHFSSIINSLRFEQVHAYDIHSKVAKNTIDRLTVHSPIRLIEKVALTIKEDEGRTPSLFFPDDGSVKRYENICHQKYCFGVKYRNPEDAKIKELTIYGDSSLIKNHPILIIDDICSAGGTFYEAAKQLKEMGAGNIYLWVTHCEDNIWRGQLLGSDYIRRIYTTNSLIRRPHIKIEEFEI